VPLNSGANLQFLQGSQLNDSNNYSEFSSANKIFQTRYLVRKMKSFVFNKLYVTCLFHETS